MSMICYVFDYIHLNMFHNTHRSIKTHVYKDIWIPMQKGVLEVALFLQKNAIEIGKSIFSMQIKKFFSSIIFFDIEVL